MTIERVWLGVIAGLLIWFGPLVTYPSAAQEVDPEIAELLKSLDLPDDTIITEDEMVIIDGVAVPLQLLREGLDDIDPEAAGVSEAIWLEMPIPVCWESMDPVHAEGRFWTQDAVEKSWEAVSDISFTGWQGCEDDSRGIRIEVAEQGPHVEHLGKLLDGLPGGMTLNFTFAEWGAGCDQFREMCIRNLAVHEFGHAIGLAHEHNRDDRELCSSEPQGPRPTFTVTSYDPSSVMNYCSKEWINGGRLSALDVAGALMIYGPFSEETPATGKIRIALDYRQPEAQVVTASYELSSSLSQTTSTQTETVSACIGGTHLADIETVSSLVPGKAVIGVVLTVTLRDAPDCEETDIILSSQTIEFELSEPFSDGGAAVEAGYGGYYNILSFDEGAASWSDLNIQVLAYRELGEEVASEACTKCIAAAKEAVFGPPAMADRLGKNEAHD